MVKNSQNPQSNSVLATFLNLNSWRLVRSLCEFCAADASSLACGKNFCKTQANSVSTLCQNQICPLFASSVAVGLSNTLAKQRALASFSSFAVARLPSVLLRASCAGCYGYFAVSSLASVLMRFESAFAPMLSLAAAITAPIFLPTFATISPTAARNSSSVS